MAPIEVGRPSAGVSWVAVLIVGLCAGVALGAFIRDAIFAGRPCECRVRP